MTTPYIGSKISLISRLDIRYEGTLHSVDPVESTISLSQVRSFGTEDRPAPVPVPARQDVYEFIIFKASDIKDLIVCETPKPVPPKPAPIDDITYDPAIISISKPPPVAQQQQHKQKQQNLSEERKIAQECSQASSPQIQQTGAAVEQQPVGMMQQQQAKPSNQFMNNNNGTGGFGQSVQRAYYNRAMAQQPAAQQEYNYPPPRTYHAQQQQRQPPTFEQQGQNRRSGPSGPQQQNRQMVYRQYQHRPHYNNYNHQQQQRHQQPAPRFEGDYDFEKANEQFRDSVGDGVEQIVEKLSNAELQEKNNDERASQERTSGRGDAKSGGQVQGGVANKSAGSDEDSFYDKNLSFFDDISCEASERKAGGNNRVDWKKERLTNQETFGTSAVRMQHNFRRGPRGGGHPQNRSYYHQQHYYQQQRYNNNGGENQRYGGMGGRQQQQQQNN